MSHKVVNLVYSRIVGSAHRKSILAYMADRASDGGEGVYCSKGTISDETEIARSTVFKVIKELVSEGILIEVGSRPCANGHTVVYDMDLGRIECFPKVARVEKKGPDQSVSRTRPSGDQSAGRTPPVRQPDPDQSVSRTLTILGTPLEPEEPLCVPPADDPPPKRPKRAIALPTDWTPSDRNLADAFDRQFTEQEIRDEADKFRDYHLARGTTFKDWDAGWRTWLGNARKFSASRGMARGPVTSRGQSVGGLVGAVMRDRASRAH